MTKRKNWLTERKAAMAAEAAKAAKPQANTSARAKKIADIVDRYLVPLDGDSVYDPDTRKHAGWLDFKVDRYGESVTVMLGDDVETLTIACVTDDLVVIRMDHTSPDKDIVFSEEALGRLLGPVMYLTSYGEDEEEEEEDEEEERAKTKPAPAGGKGRKGKKR